MNDTILSKIKYGARVSISLHDLQSFDGTILNYMKEKLAMKLGLDIIKTKGWIEEDSRDFDAKEYSVNLYVFTPDEIEEFLRQERSKWQDKQQTRISEEKAKVWDEAFNIAAECFSEGKSYDKFLHKWSEAATAKEKENQK